MKHFLLVLALVLLSCACAAEAYAQQAPSIGDTMLEIDSGSEAARHIRLATARRIRTSDNIAATASVEPDANAVAQVSTRIPARVVKLIAQTGQTVKPGEPLAILSSVELGEAKTEYLKTKSLESIAEQNLKREQDLYTRQISALKDVLTARAAHDTALAEYRAAREKLMLLIPPTEIAHLTWSVNGRPFSEFPLTSPIAGTLVRREMAVGEAVSSDRPLMTVINLDQVWVNTNIFESDLAAIRIGDRATVKVVAYPENSFEGRLSFIGDEVDRKTRTVLARIEVPNPDHLLKPGMFAHAVILASGGSREAVVIPVSAVFDYGGTKIVFTAAGPNRYRSHPVELGSETHGGVEIASGLSEGDKVVESGGLALKGLLIKQGSK